MDDWWKIPSILPYHKLKPLSILSMESGVIRMHPDSRTTPYLSLALLLVSKLMILVKATIETLAQP